MHNYIYTLIIIKHKDLCLLQNRIKSPWNGMWNGIGGKKENNETSLDCIIREVYEETTIKLEKSSVLYKGVVTWDKEDTYYSGMDLYYVELDHMFIDLLNTNEGIMTWKKIDWAIRKDNIGVAPNMKYLLENINKDTNVFNYHCIFDEHGFKRIEVHAL